MASRRVSRRLASSPGGRATRGDRVIAGLPISVVAMSDEERIGLLRTAGVFGSGRRRARGIRLSRTAARRGRADGEQRASVRSSGGAVWTIAPRLKRQAVGHRLRCPRSLAGAPLCGCFGTACHSPTFRFGECTFERPYNIALEPTAFSRRVFVGATSRRGSARTVGRTGETKNTDHFRRSSDRIGLRRASGSSVSGRRPVRADGLFQAAAHCRVSFRSAVVTRGMSRR